MSRATTVSDLIYDPYDDDVARDPWAVYRRLRDEAPLYRNHEHDFYALSRFTDVERAHKDRDALISGRGVTLGVLQSGMEFPPGTVVMEDPPSHDIHRALLSRMFTPRRIAELEPQIRQLCDRIFEPLVGCDGFDFVADISKQLPMRVIGMLVGIPEHDQESVRDFYEDSRKLDNDDRGAALDGSLFTEYLDWRADHPSDDIMTQLMYTEFEDEHGVQRTLTRQELGAYVAIVAGAGNETTRNWISWTAKLLAENPDQRRLLVDDPSLIPNAMEESLRCEPPSPMSCRYVARDLEYHGQTVPEGSIMALLIPAANRDERQFPDPDRFDVRRTGGHFLTFGFGTHYCLGQALARLEGRVIFDEVLKRFPHWDVDIERAVFSHDDPEVRGWSSLPVAIP
jgi:cytochrome P450